MFLSCHAAGQTQIGIPYHAFALRNFLRVSKLIHPITVSVLPRRVANPKWHTLSQFCVMLLFAIFKIDAPYHCFCLATPRGKPKMAYPITFCAMLLFAFLKIDAPYHCFSLATPRGKPRMAYPLTVLRHATLCDLQN